MILGVGRATAESRLGQPLTRQSDRPSLPCKIERTRFFVCSSGTFGNRRSARAEDYGRYGDGSCPRRGYEPVNWRWLAILFPHLSWIAIRRMRAGPCSGAYWPASDSTRYRGKFIVKNILGRRAASAWPCIAILLGLFGGHGQATDLGPSHAPDKAPQRAQPAPNARSASPPKVVWPDNGIAQRRLEGGFNYNMFVENDNGTWRAWVQST